MVIKNGHKKWSSKIVIKNSFSKKKLSRPAPCLVKSLLKSVSDKGTY